MKPAITYTQVDEAPALAAYSLLPIIRTFLDPVGVQVESRDISLAGRILAAFADRLTPEQLEEIGSRRPVSLVSRCVKRSQS